MLFGFKDLVEGCSLEVGISLALEMNFRSLSVETGLLQSHRPLTFLNWIVYVLSVIVNSQLLANEKKRRRLLIINLGS